MKKVMISGLVLLIVDLISESHAHEAYGIYCNVMAQTWRNAKESCAMTCTGGSLVSYDTGIGKTVAQLSLTSDADFWTADYTIKLTGHRYDDQNLCGFVYLDNSSLPVNNEVLYGSCSVERNYICMEEGKLVVYRSTWNKIKTACKKQVYRYIIIKAGLYWTTNSTYFRVEKGTILPTSGSVLCGAYSPNIGQFFTNCETKRTSLCQCSSNAVQSLDKSCFIRQTTPTTMSLKTPTIRTKKMVNKKQTDKIIGPTIGRSTDSVTSTMNKLQSGENQLMVESSTNLNRNTLQNHQFKEQIKAEHDSDIGLKVGLTTAAGLMILLGVIIFISVNKRKKQKSSNKRKKDPTYINTNVDNNMYETLDQRNADENSYCFLEEPCSKIEDKSPYANTNNINTLSHI